MARERQVLLRGGTVVDSGGTRRADVLLRGEIVAGCSATAAQDVAEGTLVLDVEGCVVAPGLVDLHTHLREPGLEEAETVETGARAAALGGYTAVVAMPNTVPATDNPSIVRHVQSLAKAACCDVHPAGALTVGREGKVLAPMAEMAALGVTIFSDDGSGLQDGALMRGAMEQARALGVVVADHCEEASLAGNGCVNEGKVSARLGLPGRPAASEQIMVTRDLVLAQLTGARLHVLHVSTAAALAAVRAAKADGANVTAEVTPHHLVLTEDEIGPGATQYKVNPPLRTFADVLALRGGLGDGTIDAVATDHAPHPERAKSVAFPDAAPGMTGLETSLALCMTELQIPLERVLALMSWLPARIAGLSAAHGGPVAAGGPANLCVIDPARHWVVDPQRMASRSRNTPFAGRALVGKVRHTFFAGEPVVLDGEAQR